jgi:hypothetical protein
MRLNGVKLLITLAARKVNTVLEHAQLYACCRDVESYSRSREHCQRRPGVDTLTAPHSKTLHSTLLVPTLLRLLSPGPADPVPGQS